MYHTYRDYRFTASVVDGTMMENQYRELIDVLEQNKPSRICELGCGQSTIIFEQYCDKYHTTMFSIEDDEMYFHKNTILMPVIEHTTITLGDILFGDCNRYDGLETWLTTQDPFDLLMVDGPKGCWFRERYKYGRVQMLSFVIPNKLNPTATVLYHDSERANAKHTLEAFEEYVPYKFTKRQIESNVPTNHTQLTIYQLIGDN